MERRLNDLRSGIIVLLMAVLGYFWLIPSQIVARDEVEMGPDFLPKLLIIIIGLCGLILVVQNTISLYKDGGLNSNLFKIKDIKGSIKQYIPHIAFILGAFIYLKLMPILGFVLASIPLLTFLLWHFGHSKIGWCLMMSTIYVIALYVVFSNVFRIRFPIGPLGF